MTTLVVPRPRGPGSAGPSRPAPPVPGPASGRHRRRVASRPATRETLLDLLRLVAPWGSAGSVAALTALAGLVVWSLLPLLAGWDASVVMSGSMRPAIHEGDVVLTQPPGDLELRPGLVVRFPDDADPDRAVLHRVVSVDVGGSLRTQGDANPTPDGTPLAQSDVTGVGRLRVPWVGSLVLWARTGRFVELGLGLTVVVGLVLSAGAAPPPARRARHTAHAGAGGRGSVG